MSIQNKFRAGEKRIEMHPALSQVFYLLENGLLTLENYGKPWHGVFRIEKITRKPSKWFGFERVSTYHDLDKMGNLGFENATNPPIYYFKMMGRIWNTQELRDFRHHIKLDLQSKTTSSTPLIHKESESTHENKFDFNTPNTKAVTVNDILGALSLHFEKVEGQADLDLCWEKWPFSPNSKMKDPEIQRRTYNSNPDLYSSYIEGSECKVEDFWTEVWDDPRGQIDRTDLPDCEDEDLDEEWDLWEQKNSHLIPDCSCEECEKTASGKKDQGWEKLVEIREFRDEAIKYPELQQLNASALVICKSKILPELRTDPKGGIVADLNEIGFAGFYAPGIPLRLKRLNPSLL